MAADPTLRIARRMAGIEAFQVMDLLARARELEGQGRSIVHMEIGEPDFPTPEPIVAAAQRALSEGRTHYTPALGLPSLRQAVASFYKDRYGVSVSAERVVITPGASGALLLALGVLLNAGEKVLLADPGYPCNRHFARFLEGDALSVPVGPESAYQLNGELVARYWGADTVAALIASPSNPTGTVVERGELAAIAAAVEARGGTLISDEIYHGLVYPPHPRPLSREGRGEATDAAATAPSTHTGTTPLTGDDGRDAGGRAKHGALAEGRSSAPSPLTGEGRGEGEPPIRATSALEVSDKAFVINSFSKYFQMTGWRLGWLVVPEGYRRAVEKLAQNLFIAASTPAQHAALAAFEPATIAILEARRAEMQRRRDYLLPALRELGFEVPVTPAGAFYIYADCSRFSMDSQAFSRDLLEQAGVAVTPGADFGAHQANRYLRFAYTTDMAQLEEGIARLRRYLHP